MVNSAPQHRRWYRLLQTGITLAWLGACALATAQEALPPDSSPAEPESVSVLDVETSPVFQRFVASIEALERSGGAFAAGIEEQLLGLGQWLQQQGRHPEAVEAFKRGAHIARVNQGLYGSEQIPLVRGEIASLRALEDYEAVDERQRYLYRVESRALGEGQALANALIRQGEWQRDAYLLGIDDEEVAAGRLVVMWDVYRLALTQLLDVYGSEQPELIPALEGMLTSQYLIAGYRGYENSDYRNVNQRISMYTGQAYERGKSVLRALLEIHAAHNGNDPIKRCQDLLRLGDWSWWFGNNREAQQAYDEAWVLAMATDASGTLAAELFAEPVALPAIEGLPTLPPRTLGEEGDLVIAFTVNETGRVTDLERLREPDVEFDIAMTRLLRRIRDTRFRPRMVDGVPADTEGLVWSFNAEDWEAMR